MSPALPTRKLGKNGPHITALGFGTMGLSSSYGAPESDEKRFEVLDHAYEKGELFWDTADMYQDSEDLLGKWFKRSGKRNEIFLASKFGFKIINGKIGIDSTPEYAKEALQSSLDRLGVDHIDLYYCHRVDGSTPIEKTVQALAEFQKAGLVKYIGLSEVSSETLRRAYKVHPIDAVQVEYSPFALDIEDPKIALLQTCRELGVAIVAYSPLGRGFITGQYKSPADFEDGDFRKYLPRFSEENFPKNLKLVDALSTISKKKGCTSSQLTLAFLLAQGEDIIPIPGTTKIKYLNENLGALWINLTVHEVREIRAVIEAAEIHGTRYPEHMLGSLFADTPALSNIGTDN